MKIKKQNLKNSGYTLIEILVGISIIAFIVTSLLAVFNNARKSSRDARRLADMKSIQTALDLYLDTYGGWPAISADACCDGWDQGPCGSNSFIGALETYSMMKQVPTDPQGGSCVVETACCASSYSYYVYAAGSDGCEVSNGAFYVLGVRNMETSGRPHPLSPGFACPGVLGRNWQLEFDWVTGRFEKL